jgi:hypothetical protein
MIPLFLASFHVGQPAASVLRTWADHALMVKTVELALLKAVVARRSRGRPWRTSCARQDSILGPRRGEKTWDEFLRIHGATLWQCYFFTKRARGPSAGCVICTCSCFLNVASRKVFVTKATGHLPGKDGFEQKSARVVAESL